MMADAKALQVIDECASLIVADDVAMREWSVNYAQHHRHRLADDLTLIQRTAGPSQRVVEFGSTPPFLTLALAREGFDVVGLDIAPDRFSEAITRHDLDVRAVDFERQPVPLESESFDVALFNEVFEHMRIDLIATMTEVRRVLRVGGVMMLSTPNMRSLRGLWTLAWHRSTCHVGTDLFDEYDKLRRLGHMGHVREYTADEVSQFLARVGFKLLRVEYRHYGPPTRKSLPVRVTAALERLLCLFIPSLRPLFTIVCVKTDDDPSSAEFT